MLSCSCHASLPATCRFEPPTTPQPGTLLNQLPATLPKCTTTYYPTGLRLPTRPPPAHLHALVQQLVAHDEVVPQLQRLKQL